MALPVICMCCLSLNVGPLVSSCPAVPDAGSAAAVARAVGVAASCLKYTVSWSGWPSFSSDKAVTIDAVEDEHGLVGAGA